MQSHYDKDRWIFIDDWSIVFFVFGDKGHRQQKVELRIYHIHRGEGEAVNPTNSQTLYIDEDCPLLYSCPRCKALLPYKHILTAVKLHVLAKTGSNS